MIAQEQHAVEQRLVVGRQHAALAGDHGLRTMKAERRNAAEGAGAPAMARRADRLGGVLDQRQPAAVGDRLKALPLAGRTVEIDAEDRLGLRPDRRLDRVGIEAPGVGQDVDQHRLGADIDDRRDRGDPGDVRRDDFVAGADPQRGEREMQRRGRMRHGHRMSDADIVGEHALEARVIGVVILAPGGARRLGGELGLALGDRRRGDGNAFGSDDHARAPQQAGVGFAGITIIQRSRSARRRAIRLNSPLA